MAYLREFCALGALGLFLLGFTALSAVVVDGGDGAHDVTLAEALR